MSCSGVSFNPDQDMPDLSGKVVLVTGGNAGLGFETIRQLSKHNPALIYLAARSQAKGEEAIKKLNELNPKAPPIKFLSLDLASFDSIKAAARTFRHASDRLDILINNAGIMMTPEGLTKEGYEIQFGTNHMGPALFTQLLLPTLKHTATINPDVRVIFLSSNLSASAPKNTYQLGELKTTMPNIATRHRYGISKVANIHYAAAFAERHRELKCISVHPGIVLTNLTRPLLDSYPGLVRKGIELGLKATSVTVDEGALNQLWAATSTEAKSGVFYYPVGMTGKGSKLSENEEQREKLWSWTLKELQDHV
ncbi:short chain dehydrogenase, partial [Thelonectria olida]